MRRGIVALLIVFALPSSVLGQDEVSDLTEYYLDLAEGSDTRALALMAKDLLVLTFDVEQNEYQIEVLNKSVDIMERAAEHKEPSWTERFGNSTFFKMVLFCGGVWLGIYAGGK